ncbi:MAG TPA: hypothetical protein VHJ57_02520 [Nitrososphaeraceae archaeon]|nr:hypothetical protein [Nitrososphaeraceae archaeon]
MGTDMKNRQDRSNNNNNDNKNYKKKKLNEKDFLLILTQMQRNHSLIYGSDILLLHGTKCTMNIQNIQQE